MTNIAAMQFISCHYKPYDATSFKRSFHYIEPDLLSITAFYESMSKSSHMKDSDKSPSWWELRFSAIEPGWAP